MEKENIVTPEIVKNEHYASMLGHLDSAIQNWKHFSRLDRLEYAYKCLELARNYTCSTRGIDPSTIKPALEILDHAGQTHSAKYPDGSVQSVVTLSAGLTLMAFKQNPERILATAIHECTHACDMAISSRPHLENLPYMGQVKVGDPIYPDGMQKELSASYSNFGLAWLGSPDEVRANEVGYGVTTNLLHDLAEEHRDNLMYQTRHDAFEKQTSVSLKQQYDAQKQLEQWEAELLKKYTPVGQTELPTVTEDMISTSFSIPTHSFVDIDTIRSVAEENPEVFKKESYVETELNGATNKQEIEAQPHEVLDSFKQKNSFCIESISQAITPQETMQFFPVVEVMELN